MAMIQTCAAPSRAAAAPAREPADVYGVAARLTCFVNALRTFDRWSPECSREEQAAALARLLSREAAIPAADHANARWAAAWYKDFVRLYGEDSWLVRRSVESIDLNRAILPLAAAIPISDFPRQLDLTGYERLLRPALRIESAAVKVCRDWDERVAFCPDCEKLHLRSIDPASSRFGTACRIYLRGKLAGFLKLEQQPSFLAVRTFAAEDGSTPLVQFGLYQPDRDTIARAKRTNGEFPKLQLSSLEVTPVRFFGDYVGAPAGLRQRYEILVTNLLRRFLERKIS